jgi:Protein of unknown function (DUF3006).
MDISLEHLKTFVLDRFEGEYAILTDGAGKAYDTLREALPEEAREGDILHEDRGAYSIDKELTAESRKKLKRLYDELAEE